MKVKTKSQDRDWSGNGQGKIYFKVREKSGNFILLRVPDSTYEREPAQQAFPYEFLACWSRGNWVESANLTESEEVGQAGKGGGGGACS